MLFTSSSMGRGRGAEGGAASGPRSQLVYCCCVYICVIQEVSYLIGWVGEWVVGGSVVHRLVRTLQFRLRSIAPARPQKRTGCRPIHSTAAAASLPHPSSPPHTAPPLSWPPSSSSRRQRRRAAMLPSHVAGGGACRLLPAATGRRTRNLCVCVDVADRGGAIRSISASCKCSTSPLGNCAWPPCPPSAHGGVCVCRVGGMAHEA